jgi:hypothetical protein
MGMLPEMEPLNCAGIAESAQRCCREEKSVPGRRRITAKAIETSTGQPGRLYHKEQKKFCGGGGGRGRGTVGWTVLLAARGPAWDRADDKRAGGTRVERRREAVGTRRACKRQPINGGEGNAVRKANVWRWTTSGRAERRECRAATTWRSACPGKLEGGGKIDEAKEEEILCCTALHPSP